MVIDYIGDISKADALVLKELAETHTAILEFGPGASTQVLAAYTSGHITSVETEEEWIEKAKANLMRLGLREPRFILYEEFMECPGGPYDLVFDDGVTGYRLDFALLAWKQLKYGGSLCLHDTRTTREVKNVAELLVAYSAEIHSMTVNKDHSNITVIRKKPPEHYENWNLIEGREPWQIGG